jgi:trans-aconitate methyltransferase
MGKELNKEFYDSVFEYGGSEEMYFKDYKETSWFPVWSKIIDIISDGNFKNVLDIGCGPGQFANQLIDTLPEIKYTGLDFSYIAIDQAIKRVPSFNFIIADALKFDFNSLEYDVVVSTEFLEHVVQDKNILQSLKSGVLILATLPNMDSEGHVRFLSKDVDAARSEILDHYGDICEILEITYHHYENTEDNGDYLIKMVLK